MVGKADSSNTKCLVDDKEKKLEKEFANYNHIHKQKNNIVSETIATWCLQKDP